MTPSKAFLLFCLSFIGGIFIASFFKVPQLLIYELLVLGAFYGLLFRKHKTIVVFAFCLIILALSILRTESSQPTEVSLLSQTEQTEGQLFSGLKQKLRQTIFQNLSPPQSSILAAILLGDKKMINVDWQERLNITGLRHITAISGMHIVILSQILFCLGIFFGLYRGQVFYFATILLWLFILLTGFQPSAVRAGIMGSLFLLSQKIGRQKSGGRLLVIAATAMLIADPSLLRHNVGFQLSFSATLGIIYLMPFFKNLLDKIKPLEISGLSSLLAMTFAAQVFTLPLLIYNFGYVSLVSPLTNILIVPLLPYMMGAGFLFLIFGVFWQPLAWLLSWPVFLLLSYLTSIVHFFSQIPWASLAMQTPHWLWLCFVYLVLGLFVWRLNKGKKLFAFLRGPA